MHASICQTLCGETVTLLKQLLIKEMFGPQEDSLSTPISVNY